LDPRILDALFGLRGKVELGLGPSNRLLERLGRPELDLKWVHLAGTNGKGSTLAGLEALFLASGAHTGAFISPHLVRFNERFRLDGQPVSDIQLMAALTHVCALLGTRPEALPRATEKALGASFFEISLSLAMVIFKEAAVDWALIETGLGGRLDATNALQNPKASVITRIGLDHREYLGETLAEIALEKLAILRPHTPSFLAPQTPQINQLALDYAQSRGLDLQPCPTLEGWDLGLNGAHQKENLGTALACFNHLCPNQLDEAAQKEALAQVRWPGRLEYVNPHFLIDGAHNAQGLASLFQYLRDQHPGKHILLALGWMTGKRLFEGLDQSGLDLTWQPIQGGFQGAEPNPEATLSTFGPCLPTKVLSQFCAHLPPQFDLIVLAGSLYLLGEFKSLKL